MKLRLPDHPSALAASLLLAVSGGAARAVPIHAQVLLNDKDQTEMATYVVAADAQGVYCSGFPNGANPKLYPHGDIKDIAWTEPKDWTAAKDLYVRRQYPQAAVALGAVYDNYKDIRSLEDSFAAMAKFYQCESLRLSGQYPELVKEYDVLKDVRLSRNHAAQAKLFNCWGHVGKELWAPLSRIMKEYEIPVEEIPATTIPPTGLPFKKVSPREIIQIAYLRGISTHKLMVAKRAKLAALVAKDDERDKPEIDRLTAEVEAETMSSLHDYSRAMTVTYGDEKIIMANAMLNYLQLATEAEDFKDNYVKQREAHVVALLYSQLHGNGKVPSEYVALLKEPEKPKEDE